MDTISISNKNSNFLKNKISLNANYQYSLLTPEYLEQVIELFSNAFCTDEPMTHYLNLDESSYKIFTRAVTEKAIADKLSVIALDKDKVVACALVEDIADPGSIPDFDPKFEYILALLDKLGKKFFSCKTFQKKNIAHLFITAVDKNYRHQGLSTQVNFLAMDVAAQNGFDFVYCEFTHIFNEYGVLHHLKNRKKLIGSAIYDEFTVNDVKPFSHLTGGANAYLWEIKENAQLKYEENSKEKIEEL